MSTPRRPLALAVLACLCGCPTWEPLPGCGDVCSATAGPLSTGAGGSASTSSGDLHTVTSAGEPTTTAPLPPATDSTTTGTTSGTTSDEPAPAVLSVIFKPNPIQQVGLIDVDAATEHTDHVTMAGPEFTPVELVPGQNGHFFGTIEVLSGLANGLHPATFTPRLADVPGADKTEFYEVALPEAGSEVLWDVVPDEGPGQIDALAVLGDSAVLGLGTVFNGNDARCFLHRRNLDGTYGAGDVKPVFPELRCTAVDLVTVDATIYLLVHVTTPDGPRWRIASMTWGETPKILRNGGKDEFAHALAHGPSGQLVACGTGPSPQPLMDTIDGRIWTLSFTSETFDYKPPAPEYNPHWFDETITDCAFAGDKLVLVGEVYGPHEMWENGNQAPKRRRPFLLEIVDQNAPTWIVPGLGPGNTTQGGATALAIDEQGRTIVALYTCGDECERQGELRMFEPGGAISWQTTLPADVSMPFDVAWSPAGYAVVAAAKGDNKSSQFLLQAYLPGTYSPAWTFAKGKSPGWQAAFAVTIAPGVVVGGGLGIGGYPAFAFLNP